MPFCSNCGKEVSKDTKFCPRCGQRLKEGFTLEERNKHIEEFKVSVEGGKPPKKTKTTRKKIAGIIGGCAIAVIVIAAVATPGEPTPAPIVEPSPAPIVEPSPVPSPTESTVSTREISLDDASIILDISSDLPPGFNELNPGTEGMSNEDLMLGPDFSETRLFLREDPFNSVLVYMTVVKGRLQQAAEDAYLRDEEQLKEDLSYWLDVGAVEEGMEVSSVDYSMTYPDVGDAAGIAHASVVYDYLGMEIDQEMEILFVREEEAYVFVVSFHMGESISLEELGRAIVARVHTL